MSETWRAEYERLSALKLGHTRADIRLRIRRAQLASLAYQCPSCSSGEWTQCHTAAGRRATRPHSKRSALAVQAIIEIVSNRLAAR